MTKPLVIYHANCADGFGAAFAAWTKLGDEADYMPMQYGEKMMSVDLAGLIDEEVYILDFSFPRDVMDWLFANARRVVWLDHHKTAFEMWCGKYNEGDEYRKNTDTEYQPKDYIILSSRQSGAYLAWEYFHPGEEVPRFIMHIDDYDRWQFKLEGTKAFNKALWSYAPWSFSQWVDWFYDCEEGFYHTYWAEMYVEGTAILRAHEQHVQSVVQGAMRGCRLPLGTVTAAQVRDLRDRTDMPMLEAKEALMDQRPSIIGLAANCPSHLASDVGHELALQSGTFGLCWSMRNDGGVKCSLRSIGDYDVSAIAKTFGGGGHMNAASFHINIQTLMGWLK